MQPSIIMCLFIKVLYFSSTVFSKFWLQLLIFHHYFWPFFNKIVLFRAAVWRLFLFLWRNHCKSHLNCKQGNFWRDAEATWLMHMSHIKWNGFVKNQRLECSSHFYFSPDAALVTKTRIRKLQVYISIIHLGCWHCVHE